MNKILIMLKKPGVAFIVALIVHVSVVFLVGHYKHPVLWENGNIAGSLANGKGFSILFSRPDEPTSWQAPGYPYLLCGAWKCLGAHPTTYLLISLLQAVLVSSMVFPVSWLTKRWFGPSASVVALWIVCFMPLYGWYPTRLHQPALVIFFHPWLLAGWLRLYDKSTAGRAVTIGAGTGVAGLFQPVMLAVFGIVAIVLGLKTLIRRKVAGILVVVLAGICTLVVLTPWTIRNYRVHHRLVPIKNSFGKELWMGNNPNATGSAFALKGQKDIFQAFPPKCMSLWGKVSEIEFMDAMLREALDYIREAPGAFVMRTAKKIVWFWTAVPPSYLRSFGDAEAVRFWWLHTGYWIGFLALMVLAWWKGGSFVSEYNTVLGVYIFVYSITYGLTIVGNARFRGEIEYIFIPAVAAGVICLNRLFTEARPTAYPFRK